MGKKVAVLIGSKMLRGLFAKSDRFCESHDTVEEATCTLSAVCRSSKRIGR